MALVCGTGDWSGPKPGDPNSNIKLWATPAFGGIDVGWTYPTINPHAVAHVILYRSSSPDVDTSTTLAIVNGSTYYDKTTSASSITWFYWVQVVSVNGTYGEMVGPISSTARPTIEDIMLGMSTRIDEGVLAQDLREKIEKITLNSLQIDQEILNRAAEDAELGAAYNEVMAYSENTRALLQSEVLAQASKDAAFVDSVNTLYAQVGEDVAAIRLVQSSHVDALKSQAADIKTVEATLNGSTATGEIGLVSTVEKVAGKADELGSLYTVKLQSTNVEGQNIIGGFGVYNNGQTVQAGFDVDQFWIGRTSGDGTKPFIMEGEEVFIKEAVIKSLTFNKLRADDNSLAFEDGKLQAKYIAVEQLQIKNANISGDIQSDNYVQGKSGWILKK